MKKEKGKYFFYFDYGLLLLSMSIISAPIMIITMIMATPMYSTVD
jgi:hypothetical protein